VNGLIILPDSHRVELLRWLASSSTTSEMSGLWRAELTCRCQHRALHSPWWRAGMGHREFASARHGNAKPLLPELTRIPDLSHRSNPSLAHTQLRMTLPDCPDSMVAKPRSKSSTEN